MSDKKPIILCVGSPGRAVVFGYVSCEPVPGEPVTLERARMVLRWDAACGGLFGLAARGPKGDTRLTPAVERTTATVWSESVTVSPRAADALSEWRSV